MISALYRYPKNERRPIAREWAHRSNAAQTVARQVRGVDADTLHRRALHDARGQLLRHGCTFTASGVVEWEIRRSRSGRVNQLDVFVSGRLWRTAGARRIARWLRRGR